MELYITSLASGSNGNCYYVGNDETAVLIDAGISCRETERRMARLRLSMQKVKAIFISHEHSDHIRGLTLLSKKYNLPVYITAETLRCCPAPVEKHLVKPFTTSEPVNIGSLQVKAFSKAHDAAEPHSFVISYKQLKVGVFTDIGTPCQNLRQHFSQCHAAFLESNFDEAMLDGGRYPLFLKNRIRGGMGHLSNRQALELFQTHRSPQLRHLVLSHLSKENNCPKRGAELVGEQAGDTNIVVASRDNEMPVLKVSHHAPLFENFTSLPAYQPPTQMSMF